MVSARAIARPAMRGAGRSVRHRFVRAYALQFALSVSHVHVHRGVSGSPSPGLQ